MRIDVTRAALCLGLFGDSPTLTTVKELLAMIPDWSLLAGRMLASHMPTRWTNCRTRVCEILSRLARA